MNVVKRPLQGGTWSFFTKNSVQWSYGLRKLAYRCEEDMINNNFIHFSSYLPSMLHFTTFSALFTFFSSSCRPSLSTSCQSYAEDVGDTSSPSKGSRNTQDKDLKLHCRENLRSHTQVIRNLPVFPDEHRNGNNLPSNSLDLRLSRRQSWLCGSSGIWHSKARSVSVSVLEKHK